MADGHVVRPPPAGGRPDRQAGLEVEGLDHAQIDIQRVQQVRLQIQQQAAFEAGVRILGFDFFPAQFRLVGTGALEFAVRQREGMEHVGAAA